MNSSVRLSVYKVFQSGVRQFSHHSGILQGPEKGTAKENIKRILNTPEPEKPSKLFPLLGAAAFGVTVYAATEKPAVRVIADRDALKQRDIIQKKLEGQNLEIVGYHASHASPEKLSPGDYPYCEDFKHAIAYLNGKPGFITPVVKPAGQPVVTAYRGATLQEGSYISKSRNGHDVKEPRVTPDLEKGVNSAVVHEGPDVHLVHDAQYAVKWDPPVVTKMEQTVQDVKDEVARHLAPNKSTVFTVAGKIVDALVLWAQKKLQ